MKTLKHVVISGMVLAVAWSAAPVQAASVSYYLNQSNTEDFWPDGPNYLDVTISDSISNPGDIEFLVTALAPLTSLAVDNFGIQRFGFNTSGAANVVLPGNIVAPSGWTTEADGNMDGFGNFELMTSGTGSTRQNPLAFLITGVAGDTVNDYHVLNSGGGQGFGFFYAAHVAGMSIGGGSAYFAGTVSAPVVPVPAAVWLLGSALGLLGLVRRRIG